MKQAKVNAILLVVLGLAVGWVAGNLWEGRRTDRVCNVAYDLMGLARLDARGQTIIEDQLARECEPAQLSSAFD